MKAKLRGTEIYFDIAGMQLRPDGQDLVEKPVLFLLHGGPGGDHLRFKQHSIDLQAYAQLVFVDHRGCGRSKKTTQKDYTLENNIEDLEALRKHLGLEKIAVMGVSYGGIVAQGYALRYPKHLGKLILAVTAPSYRFMEEAKQTVKERGTAKQMAVCERLWEGSFKTQAQIKEYFKHMDALYSVRAKKKGTTKTYGKSHTRWSLEALNEGFGGFLRKYDYVPQLKKIRCPTLVLAGEKDWICSPNQSKIIAREIPKAQLKIFKNAGHAVAMDAHKEYIKTIRNFLTKK